MVVGFLSSSSLAKRILPNASSKEDALHGGRFLWDYELVQMEAP